MSTKRLKVSNHTDDWQRPRLTSDIIMSHAKHTYRRYMRISFTPRDSLSTNQEGRFSLVTRQYRSIHFMLLD